ncbi:MAG: transglycosylase domain-containing protein [Flavobacteriaceae bacterium]|nr:transglycosylase domain-containing protein [Flavobacteriaceae bacterium]
MTKKSVKKVSFIKYVKAIWILFFSGVIFVSFMFLLVSKGVFGDLPSFEELESPEISFASEIISSDGKTIGRYAYENRTPATFDELPKSLVDAIVATEDKRYFEHSGIDAQGFARAILSLGSKGGGSTITQQLAKLLFTGRSKNLGEILIQKMKEWVISVKLERQYTKQEIITMYLNKFDFIYNATGIKSASRIYFGKNVKNLSIEESAVFASMLKNPWYYNPKRESSKARTLKRRNLVMSLMQSSGYLNEKQLKDLKKLPLKIKYSPESHSDGNITYFRNYLQKYMKKWISDNPKTNGEKHKLFSDGLKIYTTIDSRMQKYAYESVNEHMTNLQRIFFKEQKKNKTAPFYDLKEKEIDNIMLRSMKNSDRWRRLRKNGVSSSDIEKSFFKERKMKLFSWKGDIDTLMTPYDSIRYYKHFIHSSLISIEPQTGEVKAWVGGINYKKFQFDNVVTGKRQVGSTFKPFVYASVIDQLNISPCKKFSRARYTISKEKYGMKENWSPRNSGGNYEGEMTLQQAIANSVNTISAQMIDMVGPATVVRLAKRAGIKSHIPEVVSIALGTVELSLYEMVSAYSSFANKGLRKAPIVVTKIEDKNGVVLSRFGSDSNEVLSKESAYVVLDLLKGVTKFGSGSRLRSSAANYRDSCATGYPYEFKNPIAGKTGTTQNQSDGWFMGMVPNLVTGVWAGAEDRAVHFEGIYYGQGATMALPTWAIYMRKCYADSSLNISDQDFERPENLNVRIDCDDDINLSTQENGSSDSDYIEFE